MVCKNCGADLKPGIRYCLECGNYIDEDAFENVSGNGTMSGAGADGYQLRSVSKRKRKTRRLSLVDILIYAGLALIIIVSLIVIIVTLIRGQKEEVIPQPTVVTGDVTVNIDDYQVTLPGALSYDVQGSTLFVSDNQNYTFSYKNTTDDYDAYSNDLNVLRGDLSENNYEVLSIGKRMVGTREFIIGEIRINGRVKYLFLTKLGNAYTTMGVIDPFEGGAWEIALEVITDINDSVVIDGAYSNTYNRPSSNSGSTTIESYTYSEYGDVPGSNNQSSSSQSSSSSYQSSSSQSSSSGTTNNSSNTSNTNNTSNTSNTTSNNSTLAP